MNPYVSYYFNIQKYKIIIYYREFLFFSVGKKDISSYYK